MVDEKIPLDAPPAYDATGGVAVPTAAPAPPQQRPAGPRAPLPLNLPALNMIRGKRVILASASPRRRQLLAQVSPIHHLHINNLSTPPKKSPTFFLVPKTKVPRYRSASPTSKSSPRPSPKTNPNPSAPSNTSLQQPNKNAQMSTNNTLTTLPRKAVSPPSSSPPIQLSRHTTATFSRNRGRKMNIFTR